MIVLGVILLLIGYFTSLSILYTIGAILIVVGVVLMLLVIFRPQGILGDKRELRFNV